MPSAEHIIDAGRTITRTVISPYVWLVTAVLAVAAVGLNCDFDVVAGRYDETVTSGGGLEDQSHVEKDVTSVPLRRKLGFILLIATTGLAMVGPKEGATLRPSAVALLAAAALAWPAASWVWSVDSSETSRELIRLFAAAVTCALLVRRFRPVELIVMFLVVSAVAIGVDIGTDLVSGTFQPWLPEFRLGGTLHPNQMGRLGAIIALIGYAARWETGFRRWAWPLFGCGLVVVLMSVSRSGLIGLVAGMFACHFLDLSGRRVAFYVSSIVALAAIGLLVFAVTTPSLHRQATGKALMGRTEDASSLTGRMPLWQEIWQDGADHRWMGYGYGAYWNVDRNYEIARVIEWYPRHSHSIYVELMIDLGWIGLCVVLVLTISSLAQYSQLVAATGLAEYRFFGGLLACALANGFFEVGYLQPRLEGMVCGVAVLVLFLRQPEAADATAPAGGRLTRMSWRPPFSLGPKPIQRPT